jgi:thiamine biosynthesis protein ThiS
MLTIELNGEPKCFSAALTVQALIEQLGLEPTKIAIERNREIVPKSTFSRVSLADGDKIEIIHFVGGG